MYDFLDLATVIYTMNKHVGALKFVTSCDPSFGEMLGYLKEGLNDVESEGECIIWKITLAGAERKEEEIYPLQIFT